jgi:hypothetical protein
VPPLGGIDALNPAGSANTPSHTRCISGRLLIRTLGERHSAQAARPCLSVFDMPPALPRITSSPGKIPNTRFRLASF